MIQTMPKRKVGVGGGGPNLRRGFISASGFGGGGGSKSAVTPDFELIHKYKRKFL